MKTQTIAFFAAILILTACVFGQEKNIPERKSKTNDHKRSDPEDVLKSILEELAKIVPATNLLAFSPDGSIIATANRPDSYFSQFDSNVRLWDVATGKLQATLSHKIESLGEASPLRIGGVAFGPRGKMLAVGTGPSIGSTGSIYGEIRLWDTKGNLLKTLQAPHSGVNSVAVSHDGTIVAAASLDSRIALFDTRNDSRKQVFRHKKDGRGRIVSYLRFLPNKILVSWASTINLLDSTTGKLRARLGAPRVFAVTCSPDGRYIAGIGSFGDVSVWRTKTAERAATVRASRYSQILFSPDNKQLAIWRYRSGVHLKNIADGSLVKVWKSDEPVNCVAFSVDGKLLAAGGDRGTVTVWNIAKNKLEMKNRRRAGISAIAFSPKGPVLAVGTRSGKFELLKVRRK